MVPIKNQIEYFKLAGIVLDCIYNELHENCDKVFCFIGYMDYSSEMAIIIRESNEKTPTKEKM